MIKQSVTVVAVAASVWAVPGGVAVAAQGPDSKKAESITCQTGTLAGETITAVSKKAIFLEDGTQLELATFRIEFDGMVKEKGKDPGAITCGGSEMSPEGTFTYFVTFRPAK